MPNNTPLTNPEDRITSFARLLAVVYAQSGSETPEVRVFDAADCNGLIGVGEEIEITMRRRHKRITPRPLKDYEKVSVTPAPVYV